MIAGIEPWAQIALVTAVFVGATLQGVIGLGLGLILAPVTGLVAPQLLPGIALWLAMLLPLFTLTRDWRSTDLRACAGHSGRAFPVPRSACGWCRMPTTTTTLLGAGFVSGITGTVSSIGGPPLALVYQRHATDVLRATLGVYFVLGAAFSIVGLSVTGQLPTGDLLVAVGMAPVVLVGFLLSGPLRRHLDHGSVRIGLLILCASSAAALIVRSVVA